MPVVTPGVGQTVVEEKRTRILNGNESETEKFPSDSLEYMETLTPEQWQKGEHTVYIYRLEPALYKTDRNSPAYVDKFGTPITQDLIQRDYGGGLWRIVIKRGPERVCAREYSISGPPMDLTRMGSPAAARMNGAVTYGGNGNGVSAVDANQAKLIDAATNVDAQKAQVDMVKSTATELVQMAKDAAPKQMSIAEIITLAKELQPKAAPSDIWSNPLVIALATKVIERLFSNPFEQLAPIVEMVSKMNGASVAGDWKLAAAQAVPKVAESLADIVDNMRAGAEAQSRMHHQPAALPPAPQAQQPPPPPPANPPAPNSKVIEMQPPAPQGDPMEAFETKFVELLANPQVSGAQAAEILWRDWPQILTEIAGYQPELIIANAFKRPILAPHAGNPRIPQFVGELIAWVKAQGAQPKGA